MIWYKKVLSKSADWWLIKLLVCSYKAQSEQVLCLCPHIGNSLDWLSQLGSESILPAQGVASLDVKLRTLPTGWAQRPTTR